MAEVHTFPNEMTPDQYRRDVIYYIGAQKIGRTRCNTQKELEETYERNCNERNAGAIDYSRSDSPSRDGKKVKTI